MKNLTNNFPIKSFQNFKIYIYGLLVSGLVFFLKNLLTGEAKTYQHVTNAANEAIHLNEIGKGKTLLFYLKASILYTLYGVRLIIDKLEPLIIMVGSSLTIVYYKKYQSAISSYFLLNKLPKEFQELIPLIPAMLTTILGISLEILFKNIKSIFPSKYELPTHSTIKTATAMDNQVKATNFIQRAENLIQRNSQNNDITSHSESPKAEIRSESPNSTPQFNQDLLNTLFSSKSPPNRSDLLRRVL